MTGPTAARWRVWLWALAGLTLLRLVMAAWMPLSPDEAYYWIWSRALDFSYLDHPPMVAWWIGAGTVFVPSGEAWLPLGVRLLGPFSAALGSILIARAGEDLFPGRQAGLKAALLLNATLFLGVGAVTMTPDTPLLFFCALLLFALGRVVAAGDTGKAARWWLLAGGAAGAALLSKYTAILPIAGLGLWLLDRRASAGWIFRWPPWAGLALAGLLFLPVAAWNAAHHWASFMKQGGRNGIFHPTLRYLGELLGGQAGLATPGVFLLCAAGFWLACRGWRRDRAQPALLRPASLLAALTLPGAVFLEHALGDRVQANWPALLYPAACMAAGGLLAGWRWVRASVVLGLAMTALVYIQAVLAPLPLSRKLDPAMARLAGWPAFADALGGQARALHARAVAADDYALAAELAVYLPPGVEAWGVEPRWEYFRLPFAAPQAQPVLLVQSTRRREPPDEHDWTDLRLLGELTRGRDGLAAETYRLYSARRLSKAAVLPRAQ